MNHSHTTLYINQFRYVLIKNAFKHYIKCTSPDLNSKPPAKKQKNYPLLVKPVLSLVYTNVWKWFVCPWRREKFTLINHEKREGCCNMNKKQWMEALGVPRVKASQTWQHVLANWKLKITDPLKGNKCVNLKHTLPVWLTLSKWGRWVFKVSQLTRKIKSRQNLYYNFASKQKPEITRYAADCS